MALVCHPSKKVNKSDELTYLSTNMNSELVFKLIFVHMNDFLTTCKLKKKQQGKRTGRRTDRQARKQVGEKEGQAES
jgi:hypothetical protein